MKEFLGHIGCGLRAYRTHCWGQGLRGVRSAICSRVGNEGPQELPPCAVSRRGDRVGGGDMKRGPLLVRESPLFEVWKRVLAVDDLLGLGSVGVHDVGDAGDLGGYAVRFAPARLWGRAGLRFRAACIARFCSSKLMPSKRRLRLSRILRMVFTASKVLFVWAMADHLPRCANLNQCFVRIHANMNARLIQAAQLCRARARDKLARQLHGQYAWVNFPEANESRQPH